MNLNMFEQFMSPELIFTPTALMAMCVPVLLIFRKPKLLNNRMTTPNLLLMKIFMANIMNQLSLKGQKWSKLLMSLLLMILTSNLLGLLPYTFTPTSQLSMNMALAAPLWLATVILGLKEKPSISLAHLLPEGSPTPLIPFMILIETVSLLMRPIALGVRLTANITAGHLLMTMVGSASIALINNPLSLLSVALLFLLVVLELAVACIQAYVFVLLTALYLQENS